MGAAVGAVVLFVRQGDKISTTEDMTADFAGTMAVVGGPVPVFVRPVWTSAVSVWTAAVFVKQGCKKTKPESIMVVFC